MIDKITDTISIIFGETSEMPNDMDELTDILPIKNACKTDSHFPPYISTTQNDIMIPGNASSRHMTLNERIQVLAQLGVYLQQEDERLSAHIHRASIDNPWFTTENIRYALREISGRMLKADLLVKWTVSIRIPITPKRVGVIMAGNIPAVGFHDMLCVFVSGHVAVMKLSDKDKYLIPFLVKILTELDPRCASYFEFVEKLQQIDAVIATGSNNSARYFEYYFSKYPHLIRRNRNAVALFDGTESAQDLSGLCDDIFLYFGMGCRSVSHCVVPQGYSFEKLITAMDKYGDLAHHNKYRNNLEYNLALSILNRTPHIALPNLILIENPILTSPVSCLYYSTYQDVLTAHDWLRAQKEEIQCVVSKTDIPGLRCVRFGDAQKPALDDYADGIDTLAFLQNLT
jgi:hypothetical protein